MNMELQPDKYIDPLNQVYDEARDATIELLKSRGEKCFVADEDIAGARSKDNVDISVSAIGLNEAGNGIIVRGHDWNYWGDFPNEWVSTDELYPECYPKLYKAVADLIDNSMTKEQAGVIADQFS